MGIYQKIKLLNQMLNELSEVVKAKGVEININELKKLLDINHYELNEDSIVQVLINKLTFERELNYYQGLANAVVIAFKIEMEKEVFAYLT